MELIEIKLNPALADDPIYWRKFFDHIRTKTGTDWPSPEVVNWYLEDYRGTYKVDTVPNWQDTLIFQSTNDLLLFTLAWS